MVLVFNHWFLGLEVLRNNVNFLPSFGWERGWWQDFVDGDQSWFGYILLVTIVRGSGSWGEFRGNFSSKSVRFLISIQGVLSGLVN